MEYWHHSEPAHFTMACFRCDQALERIALDRTAASPLHIEAEDDRACPGCGKPWRISYSVGWSELPDAARDA